MTPTLWILDIIFIALVVLQVRARRLTLLQILLPFALVLWASLTYVHSIPTEGNSRTVLALAALAGGVLGGAAGGTTHVYLAERQVITRAGITAAVIWIFGMGVRLAFQLWATGTGEQALGRFDFEHAISNDVWPAALVLLAGATVLVRVVVLIVRGARLRRGVEPRSEVSDLSA